MYDYDDNTFVEGLVEMAEFLGDNPEMIQRINPMTFYISVYDYADEPAFPKMQEFARMLAPCEKEYGSQDFELVKHFGPHTVRVYTARENVCTKKVIGTKKVERTVYTAEDQRAREAMTPVRVLVDEEEVEWECPPSLLRDSPDPSGPVGYDL